MANPIIGSFVYALGDQNILGTLIIKQVNMEEIKLAAKRVAVALTNQRINKSQPKMVVNTKNGYDLYVHYTQLSDGELIIVTAAEDVKQTKMIQQWNQEILVDLQSRLSNKMPQNVSPNCLDKFLEKANKVTKFQMSQLQVLDKQLNDVKNDIAQNINIATRNLDQAQMLEGDTLEMVSETDRFRVEAKSAKNAVRCKKILTYVVIAGIIVVVLAVVIGILVAMFK